MADPTYRPDFPENERLYDALFDERAQGWRSPRVVLPLRQWDIIRLQLAAPILREEGFYVHSCQGPVLVLPELPC